MKDDKKDQETKTQFKGPGQWRSQARRLEAEASQGEKKS